MVFSTQCILFCLIIIGIFKIIAYYIDYKEFFKKASLLPGPKTIPILGNAHLLLKKKSNILKEANILIKLYPSIFRLWIGNCLYVTICDPKLIQTFLSSNKVLKKGSLYKFFHSIIEKGVFSTSPPAWQTNRKFIMPIFQTKKLHSAIDIFNKYAIELVNILSTKENNDKFDITDMLNIYTVQVTVDSFMGDSINLEMNEADKYGKLMSRLLQLVSKRTMNFFLHPNSIFKFSQLSKDTNEIIESLNKITNKIIQKRREFLKSEDKVIGDRDKTLFLDKIIEQCDDLNVIDDIQLQHEVNTILFSATDTTLITISFAVLVLVTFPEIQKKVYEELYTLFGSADPEDNPITIHDLNKMDYLTRVINETLRFFSPVPYIIREVMDDLNIGEYTLPKGCQVIIPISKIHKNEEFWHEPEKFNPDRFLPDEVLQRPTCCFLPFSAGLRNCMGYKFGMMAMKIVLATILRRFVLTCDEIVPLHEVKLKHEIFMKQCEPIKIRIQKRN
ncbi:cytochrome P450 4C1-like [Leptopilina boulardi]|uniref:cytochrome P450 4C1-like n=1 Tax=Leptopilina boulardi TaxID=63433 RepID=UPI0021F5F474|nr:cytochrome P450 4C1-like [Leptopilina boulardi]